MAQGTWRVDAEEQSELNRWHGRPADRQSGLRIRFNTPEEAEIQSKQVLDLTINAIRSQLPDPNNPAEIGQAVLEFALDKNPYTAIGRRMVGQGLKSIHTKLPEITRPLSKSGGKRTSLGGTNPLDDVLTEVTGIQNRRSEWLTPTEKAKLAGDPDPYIDLDPKIARKYRARDSKIQARMEQLTRPHLRNDQVGQLIRNAQSLKQKDPRLPRDFWSDSWWNLLGLKGERHHIAGLNWADSLFNNVTADTADQMRAYALKRGVEFGDVFRNRADLPIDVHKKLHAWLTKNNLDGGNIKFKGDTFAERREELDKLIEGVKASEEWIANWRRSNNIPIPANNSDLAIDKLHDQAASDIAAVDFINSKEPIK